MAEGLLDKANIILTPTGYKAGTMYNVAPIEQPYEDFDFARASVASRVNSSGLVEMVGRTLGSNLVQNGDFSEIGTDLVQNGTFDLGSELVTNGDFATDLSGWSGQVGRGSYSWDNGRAKITNDDASSYPNLSQSITTVVGKVYKIKATVEIGTATLIEVRAYSNSVIGSQQLTTDGTIEFYITADDTDFLLHLYLFETGNTGHYCYFDNVSVKEVPDWSLGAKWSVEDNYARLISTTSAGSSLIQSNVFTVGKSYKITLDAIVTSGSAKLEGSGGSEVLRIDTTQSYTLYWSADITDIIFNRRSYTSDVKITNVVVQELDPNDYWNKLNATISEGKGNLDGDGQTSLLWQDILTNGKTYKATFTVSNYNGVGSAQIINSNGDVYYTITENGTFTIYFKYIFSDGLFYFRAINGAVFSVDNVSVKEIIDTNNIPRINYDSNGENGHWLLEPTSTNLITYSEDFTQWTKSNASNINVIATTVISPDGVSFANKLYPIGTSSSSYIRQSAAAECFSIFVKKGERRWFLIYGGFANSNVWFDSENGVLGTVRAEATATVESFSNDWYRIKIIWTQNSTQVRLYNTDDDNTLVSTANNTDGLYIWGAQLEDLPYATSYIPTLTGSTETRATVTATGAGSADLINSTEGVLYAEIAALADDGTFRVISLNSGDNTNIVKLGYRSTSNAIYYEVRSGNVSQSFQIYTTTDIKEFHKVALLYKENDFKLFVNGVNVLSDTSGSTPIGLNNLSFEANSGAYFYGKCKELTVFREALSDDELEKLTSWSSFNAMATDLGYTIE